MLIGYARTQKSEGQDTSAQIHALKAAGCERIYEETAAQGRWHRPQLKKLLDELQPGQVIVVASLDRFAGSLTDLVQILNQIQSRGARFRSIAESLDTTRTTSDCAVQMLGVLAAFDRAQLKQRTSEGQRSARAKGQAGGRTAKLSPAQQREILDMLAAGRSAADLARLFRVHRATISRLVAKAQRPDVSEAAKVP